MPRIAIVTPSPLLAGGLMAALSAVADWQPCLQPTADDADTAVLHARDAREALALHAALPPELPAVLLGEDLRELATRSAGLPRALALLSPDASAA